MTIKMIIPQMRYALLAGLLSGASLFTPMSGCQSPVTRQMASVRTPATPEQRNPEPFTEWVAVVWGCGPTCGH